MESSDTNKSYIKPMTIAEMLPGLSGILSKEAMLMFSTKKSRQPAGQTRTAEKVLKPMTIAEMRAQLSCLKVRSPKTVTKPILSAKKKRWNTSVKVENKNKSHTSHGQLKENPVRKVLTFQSKPTPISRQTMVAPEIQKFPKPACPLKKSVQKQDKNIRISGICNIQETPLITNKSKVRMTISNKENIPYQRTLKKPCETAKPIIKNWSAHTKPITPLANMSMRSNSDASFLQKEKEINDIEEKTKVLCEEPTLENITEVSPPVSTPFKEYRSVQEFFNNSDDLDNSALYNDNTIMCFDNATMKNESKRDDSVIILLCDLLKKTSVSNSDKKDYNKNTKLDDLLEVEKQTENNIKRIDNELKILTSLKESQLKSLQYIRELLKERQNKNEPQTVDTTLVEMVSETSVKHEQVTPESSPVARPSVIKRKSVCYTIPKKNISLAKKVFHKSMPNVSNKIQNNTHDKARNMYMQMKQNMNFLNTPVVKQRPVQEPDTPAITSHNLQKQLDKLFNCS